MYREWTDPDGTKTQDSGKKAEEMKKILIAVVCLMTALMIAVNAGACTAVYVGP